MGNKYTFPQKFLWGTATSAHQTEGNNNNSDWWEWENSDYGPKEKSLIACDSYNRYEEDFDLCVKLNNNSVRLSVEWARIEPDKDYFENVEFEHYRKVLTAARNRGLKTFVTLHHFTNPIWVSNIGGWKNPMTPFYFGIYAKHVAERLGDLVDVFITINEPQVYAHKSYFEGTWPPKVKSLLSFAMVHQNLVLGHKEAYKEIKKINTSYKVGIVHNIVWFETINGKSSLFDKLACNILFKLNTDFLFNQLNGYIDLIGLNYYFTHRIVNFKIADPKDYVSDIGWWIQPKGLENILIYLQKYNLPVYITENGCADHTDVHRERFIREMLIASHSAIQKGTDLRGYFHWSLLDNYEWDAGYMPRFGLVEIDRENNLTRKPRPSFMYYSNICLNNEVDD